MTLPTRTLKDYRPQHDPDCAKVAWRDRTPSGACTCGLDRLLADATKASRICDDAAESVFVLYDEEGRDSFVRDVSDAVALAVLREARKYVSRDMRARFDHDIWPLDVREFDAPGAQERTTEKEDHARSDQPQPGSITADPRGDDRDGSVMTVQQARDVLLGDIRFCISAVRGNSSAPVGDCSGFVDLLIEAVRAEMQDKFDRQERERDMDAKGDNLDRGL